MKFRLFIFLALATSSFATEIDYLAKTIACEPKEEFLVSQAYEAFLTLVAKREVKEDELRFPARLAVRNDSGVVISRAFYVSPNELRGFELFVPKDCIAEKDGLLISTVGLVIDSEETKQGIRCLVLKKAQPASRANVATPRGSS